MTLGQRIQKHRLRLELSQEVLGEKLGVSRQAVSKWEADAAVPDTDKLIALSKLFGLTLNQLLHVEEPQAEVSETASPPEREKGAGETRRECGLQRVLPVLALTAVLLGMAALALSFWRTAGKLSDRIALLEQQVIPGQPFQEVRASLADYAGQTVLLTLEVHAGGTSVEDYIFIGDPCLEGQ